MSLSVPLIRSQAVAISMHNFPMFQTQHELEDHTQQTLDKYCIMNTLMHVIGWLHAAYAVILQN